MRFELLGEHGINPPIAERACTGLVSTTCCCGDRNGESAILRDVKCVVCVIEGILQCGFA